MPANCSTGPDTHCEGAQRLSHIWGSPRRGTGCEARYETGGPGRQLQVCPRPQPSVWEEQTVNAPSLDRRRRPPQSQPRDTPCCRSCEPMIQQCPAGNQKEVVWGMGSGAGAGVGRGRQPGNRQPRTLSRCVRLFLFPFFSVAGLLDRPEVSMTGTQRASLRSASAVPGVHCPATRAATSAQNKTFSRRIAWGLKSAASWTPQNRRQPHRMPLDSFKMAGTSAEGDPKTLEAGDGFCFFSSPNPPSSPRSLPVAHLTSSPWLVKMDAPCQAGPCQTWVCLYHSDFIIVQHQAAFQTPPHRRQRRWASKPGLMATPTMTQLELSRCRLEKGTSPNPGFRQRQPKSGVSCTLQSAANARAPKEGPHGPQREGQWDEVQTPSGADFRSQGARKVSGPSLQGLRAEDAIQSQTTAPNHGHPRFWHRGAWGSRIAPSPSPSTLSSVLITARICTGRLNKDSPRTLQSLGDGCPRGLGTYSPQHQFERAHPNTGVPSLHAAFCIPGT
ncbi:hypothetical protein B0T18DRAFT_196590 [Schizothecium vesticola]|uniref:Uncharacterized protein n=1 Tax=Schizothecium vesticola TaxID=314040 RepID=A0AA40K3A6_9PEZI|nr:hypothetical protein B0T18DRAFT_196590 [Schizothecium vesticola]